VRFPLLVHPAPEAAASSERWNVAHAISKGRRGILPWARAHDGQDMMGEDMNLHNRMGTFGAAFTAVAISLGASAPVAAADLGSGEAEPLKYKPAPSGTEITFTPRMWYTFISQSYPKNFSALGGAPSVNDEHVAGASEAARVPLLGGTIQIKNYALFGDATFALTALYGKSNAFSNNVVFAYGLVDSDLLDGRLSTKTTGDRIDIEPLVVFPVSEQASLFFGGRYIGINSETTVEEAEFVFQQKISTSIPLTEETTHNYFLEAGVGLTGKLSSDGRHLLFANATGMLGPSYSKTKYVLINQDDNVSEWHVGVDANVGYAYQLTDVLKFSARYRVYVDAPVENWSGAGNWLVHGPEVGLTYTFKDARESLK
jgi:hypothetical protein